MARAVPGGVPVIAIGAGDRSCRTPRRRAGPRRSSRRPAATARWRRSDIRAASTSTRAPPCPGPRAADVRDIRRVARVASAILPAGHLRKPARSTARLPDRRQLRTLDQTDARRRRQPRRRLGVSTPLPPAHAEGRVLRLIQRVTATITAATPPTRPPAMAAGMPSSKTANHAVAGLASKPMIRPAIAPITAPATAPRVAHRFSSDQRRSSARTAFIRTDCAAPCQSDLASCGRRPDQGGSHATRANRRVIRAP
jgi:hypothetical protein